MSVALHPSILINICDHFERVQEELSRNALNEGEGEKEEEDGDEIKVYAVAGAPVCGAIFGLQSGQKVELFTSIECKILSKPTPADICEPNGLGSEPSWEIDEGLLRKWVTMGEFCKLSGTLLYQSIPPLTESYSFSHHLFFNSERGLCWV